MGRWGQRLFEGDQDLDVASDISAAAGAELLHYEIDKTESETSGSDALKGLGVEATRALLNDRRLTSLFEKYKADHILFPSNNYYIVILGALAMGVGATITTEQMERLRTAHKDTSVVDGYALPLFDCGFRTEGASTVRVRSFQGHLLLHHCLYLIVQFAIANDMGSGNSRFEDAINGYKNGIPWDFSTPGPKEGRLRLAKENVRDLKACKKCETMQAELPDDKKLRACGKCHRVAYCSKDCQKDDWRNHKKNCGPADAPNNHGNPHAPLCLNQ